MNAPRPYEGLTVLDLGQGIAAPYCGMLLAQYGANVIKIEPLGGDWVRGLGYREGDFSAMSLANNWGKRSLALDLKQPEGMEIVHKIAARSQVSLENFRAGVAGRIGVGYEQLSRINPNLLYVSISGFGQTGPNSSRPVSDTVMQAFSGIMNINRGEDDVPHRVGTTIVDVITAMYAFQAVSVRLHGRTPDSPGELVDLSLMQSAASLISHDIIAHQMTPGMPRVALNPPAGTYRANDGWIAITLVKEEHFRLLCETLGAPELPDDPRFNSFMTRSDNLDEIRTIIQTLVETRGVEEWLELFRKADVLANKVNDFGDWLSDPQVAATGGTEVMQQPVVGEMPIPVLPAAGPLAGPAPSNGMQSREILAEFGYEAGQIDDLIAKGIVKQGDAA